MKNELSLTITLSVFDDLNDLESVDLRLLLSAREACGRAYAPYSHFFVGAALLFADGHIFTGSNQENAAYPSGLCAERTAIFGASSQYPDKTIEKIAVTARRSSSLLFVGATPCGACRQVLSEYENKQQKPIEIIIESNGKFYVCASVGDLLPLKFSATHL